MTQSTGLFTEIKYHRELDWSSMENGLSTISDRVAHPTSQTWHFSANGSSGCVPSKRSRLARRTKASSLGETQKQR